MSHFALMLLHAAVVAAFFCLLWKHDRRERIKLFLQVFLGMVGGGLVVAWLMFPFPQGPPAPIP